MTHKPRHTEDIIDIAKYHYATQSIGLYISHDRASIAVAMSEYTSLSLNGRPYSLIRLWNYTGIRGAHRALMTFLCERGLLPQPLRTSHCSAEHVRGIDIGNKDKVVEVITEIVSRFSCGADITITEYSPSFDHLFRLRSDKLGAVISAAR